MTTAVATPMSNDVPPPSRGAYRLEIDCPISFLGPLHVGTGERLSVISDAPILRDAAGNPYLPQSSVRGVLRDWCEREAPLLGIGRKHVWRLFGRTPIADEAEKTDKARRKGADKDPQRDGDRQGRLTVSDVPLQIGQSEVRDHVRIDRRWGAAAHGGKFDQEIVHCAGATIHLVYEGDAATDPEIVLLRSAVWALEKELLAFGGKTGWGFGWASAPQGAATCRPTNRSETGELSSYLKRRLVGTLAVPQADQTTAFQVANAVTAKESGERVSSPEAARAREKDEPCPWCWLRLDLELQFDGPMLVAGPDREEPRQNARTPDAVYLRQIDGTVVLPGSSWRGALHSHADRIATTLGRAQIAIANTLFGVVKETSGFQGLVRVGEGKPIDRQGQAIAADQVKTIWMDHVAIDRITGFAAEGKLFNCRALASPRFKVPLLVRWRAGDQHMCAAVALLFLALRDAEHGLLWVGSRTTRGYGLLKEVQLRTATLCVIESTGKRSEMAASDGLTIATLGSAEHIGAHVQALVQAWNETPREGPAV